MGNPLRLYVDYSFGHTNYTKEWEKILYVYWYGMRYPELDKKHRNVDGDIIISGRIQRFKKKKGGGGGALLLMETFWLVETFF